MERRRLGRVVNAAEPDQRGMFPTTARTVANFSRRTIGSLQKKRMAMTPPMTKASPRSTRDRRKPEGDRHQQYRCRRRSAKSARDREGRAGPEGGQGLGKDRSDSSNDVPAKMMASAMDPNLVTPGRWARKPKRNTQAENRATARIRAHSRTEPLQTLSSNEYPGRRCETGPPAVRCHCVSRPPSGTLDAVAGGQTSSHRDVGNRIAVDHDQSAPMTIPNASPNDSHHSDPKECFQIGDRRSATLAGPRQAPLQCSPPHSSSPLRRSVSADPACGRDAPRGPPARFPSEPFALYAESSQELGRGRKGLGTRSRWRSDLVPPRRTLFTSSRLSAARDGTAHVRVTGRPLGQS